MTVRPVPALVSAAPPTAELRGVPDQWSCHAVLPQLVTVPVRQRRSTAQCRGGQDDRPDMVEPALTIVPVSTVTPVELTSYDGVGAMPEMRVLECLAGV